MASFRDPGSPSGGNGAAHPTGRGRERCDTLKYDTIAEAMSLRGDIQVFASGALVMDRPARRIDAAACAPRGLAVPGIHKHTRHGE